MYKRETETDTELGKVRLQYEMVDCASNTDIPCCTYGIKVTLTGCGADDCRKIDDISSEKAQIMALIDTMCRGAVTPVAAADVVDDYLNR